MIIILVFTFIIERRYKKNLIDIYNFFTNTDKIEAIVVYDNKNDKEVIYNDKDKIQDLVNSYRFEYQLCSARRLVKHKVELLYDIKVYLSQDWVEKMEVYYVDKEIYIDSSKVSFKLNNKNCVLFFRGNVCYIDVNIN